MAELTYELKSGFFNTSRTLIINKDFVSFNGKRVNKHDIEASRYGVRWIRLDVIFGREYVVYIKDVNGRVHKINSRSFFGRNINKQHYQFAEILDAIWEYYFEDIIRKHLTQFEEGETFSIENLTLSTDGITIKQLLKSSFISWDKVRTSSYQSYFSIYSVDNPSGLNVASYYLEDWNTSVLFSVVRAILQSKKIERYN